MRMLIHIAYITYIMCSINSYNNLLLIFLSTFQQFRSDMHALRLSVRSSASDHDEVRIARETLVVPYSLTLSPFLHFIPFSFTFNERTKGLHNVWIEAVAEITCMISARHSFLMDFSGFADAESRTSSHAARNQNNAYALKLTRLVIRADLYYKKKRYEQ